MSALLPDSVDPASPDRDPADLETQRRRRQVAWAASGRELSVGEVADCPLPPEELLRLEGGHPAVREVHDSGLTAQVLRVQAQGRDWAVKRARAVCKVQGVDGQTSFLNEVQRRAEMAALPPLQRPGLCPTVYASLRRGLVVSPWIEGRRVDDWDEAGLRQLFDIGLTLLRNGFFEWDFCPGNVLRDDREVWLFDYGYLYRFDPLRHFNSAGTGLNVPQHHLAERIESRHVFGWLLRVEREAGEAAALRGFRMEKRVALEAYERLRRELAAEGADAVVLAWLDGFIDDWRVALAGSLEGLYLREAWRSHAADLEDDLKGQTCTPLSLQRADWLIAHADRWQVATYQRKRDQAMRYQL